MTYFVRGSGGYCPRRTVIPPPNCWRVRRDTDGRVFVRRRPRAALPLATSGSLRAESPATLGAAANRRILRDRLVSRETI